MKTITTAAQQMGWGIMGAGTIARSFAQGLKRVELARLTAVASRSLDKAEAFCRDLDLSAVNCHHEYATMLEDPAVDAVYIATPHPMHARWVIAAARAGKHVLCEKPAGLNHAEAMAMVEEAQRHQVFFMEAFKDRCHPQTKAVLELVREGEIGEVRMIQASFGFGGGDTVDPQRRHFNAGLGGGAILDVGCYPVAFARLIAGAVSGKPFMDPVDILGSAKMGGTDVDEWASAILRFSNGIIARADTAVRVKLDNTATIYGSKGSLHLPDPWINHRELPQHGKMILRPLGGAEKVIDIPAEHTSFGYEVQAATLAIMEGRLEAQEMTHADTLGQMKTLDLWRQQVGLTYPAETPQEFNAPLTSLARPSIPQTPMTFGEIPGMDKPVSRFIMGCDNQTSFPHAAVMFDDWIEQGGNTFDTAHIYGGGMQEKLVGDWHTSRRVRHQINLIVKGGHTPNCNPEAVRKQLDESLDRLQTDFADIYLLHRDNPDVPVGEFVDLLSELAEQGKIGVFGGSNWSIARFDEARQYAAKNNKRSMGLLSNNFSLARMNRPIWKGCISVSGMEDRAYLVKHQIPNLAWSSQARGYFVSADGGGLSQKEADDIWDSADNRERRRRTLEMAQRKNVTPVHIAAAYVLCQPFPSFALIGPRQLSETRSTLPALGLTLTHDELLYLDLQT